MIDFHTHTFWSDGELIPSEHIRHAKMKGYQAIAITDHADSSNIDTICREAVYFAKRMREMQDEITVLSGLELTHILPVEIAELTQYARAQGIEMVLVHGETIVEPVREGTNRAAVEACVDILAHPGLIDEGTVELAAKKRGVSGNHFAERALADERTGCDDGAKMECVVGSGYG